MPFPSIEHCIICDGVRPEERGKLTILGLLGFAPDVPISVHKVADPITLCFVLFGGTGDGLTYQVEFEVRDSSGKHVMPSSPPTPMETDPKLRATLILEVQATYPGPGPYVLRLRAGGQTAFEVAFRFLEAQQPLTSDVG